MPASAAARFASASKRAVSPIPRLPVDRDVAQHLVPLHAEVAGPEPRHVGVGAAPGRRRSRGCASRFRLSPSPRCSPSGTSRSSGPVPARAETATGSTYERLRRRDINECHGRVPRRRRPPLAGVVLPACAAVVVVVVRDFREHRVASRLPMARPGSLPVRTAERPCPGRLDRHPSGAGQTRLSDSTRYAAAAAATAFESFARRGRRALVRLIALVDGLNGVVDGRLDQGDVQRRRRAAAHDAAHRERVPFGDYVGARGRHPARCQQAGRGRLRAGARERDAQRS